jgi:type II secretory pathway component PulF
MKSDELAFFNQQLAGMLKAGLPLEGSLRQLAVGMNAGTFRTEVEVLEKKLADGLPLDRALEDSKLPEFYRRMLIAGRKSESLPQVLLLLADYYQQAALLGSRVKGILIYPGIVIVGCWLLSALVWVLYFYLNDSFLPLFQNDLNPWQPQLMLGMVLPTLVITALAVAYLMVVFIPGLRRVMMWKLPGLKDASIARVANLFGMMLKSGCSLNDTLPVLSQLEKGSPVQPVLRAWETNLKGGAGDFVAMSAVAGPMPPLFYWLAGSDPEDWSNGLQRAAGIYYNRARNKMDLLLSAALPVCVIFLGILILYQSYTLYSGLLSGFLEWLMYF